LKEAVVLLVDEDFYEKAYLPLLDWLSVDDLVEGPAHRTGWE
jgi:hypothetical protein